jgi:hypothetical protein
MNIRKNNSYNAKSNEVYPSSPELSNINDVDFYNKINRNACNSPLIHSNLNMNRGDYLDENNSNEWKNCELQQQANLINSNNNNNNNSVNSPNSASQTNINSNLFNNDDLSEPKAATYSYLKYYFVSMLQPSDNKLAMKLFGSKKGVLKEKLRQQEVGHWIIHPCSNFRLLFTFYLLI